MKTHILKLSSEFCDAVETGVKSFEIRINDRSFQVGDHIKFKAVYNGKEIYHSINDKEFEITYILHGWGLKSGYVALAISQLRREESDGQCIPDINRGSSEL